MIVAQRQTAIVESLRRQGAASISELAGMLGVSAMTVRRDLDELERRGLLQRTHGGAVYNSPANEPDPPFSQRDKLQLNAKQAIGQKAAGLIKAGEQIILDSGSTVASSSAYLENKSGLTVITYSLPVIQALIQRPEINLVCTGGAADSQTNALVGPLAERVLEGVRVDKAFLGATSLSLEDGFSNSNLHNLTLQRILLRVARETYLLVDSTKFARPSFWLVAGLEALTGIITDEAIPGPTLQELERAGLKVLVAQTSASSVETRPLA
jgi:DeoR/GlpR family transcriptional regulator of sugar metabolism